MANQFSQIFSVKDILSNPKLKGKLPYINYKEKELDDGRLQQRTLVSTVRKQVFDTAILSAQPYYSPLVTEKIEDKLILDGELIGDHDQVVDAVYTALKGLRAQLIWTANSADILRSALKEAERNKHHFGIDTKLYLRAQSMTEIAGMNWRQRQGLLENVMENIFYGDDFPETQKKFAVDKIQINDKYTYEQRKENWKRKVGAL